MSGDRAGRVLAAQWITLGYDPKNNPLVQAIERGWQEWMNGDCHETACGCITVTIYDEIVKLLQQSNGAVGPPPGTYAPR